MSSSDDQDQGQGQGQRQASSAATSGPLPTPAIHLTPPSPSPQPLPQVDWLALTEARKVSESGGVDTDRLISRPTAFSAGAYLPVPRELHLRSAMELHFQALQLTGVAISQFELRVVLGARSEPMLCGVAMGSKRSAWSARGTRRERLS